MITLPTQLANFMNGKDLVGLKPFALLYRNKWDSVNNKFALEDTPIDISALIAKPNTLSMTLDVNEVAQYNANNVTLTLEDTKNYFVEGTPNSYFPEGYQVYGSKVVLYYGLNTPINPYPTQVGYTVVGSPTITDGVISGFASGSYVQTDTNFSFAQPLEIRFTATTSNNVNTSQLFCSVGNENSNRSFGVTIESGAKMGVAYTTNGASWVGWLPSSYVFEANTRYNFFIDYVPSSYFTINVKKATESGWTTLTSTLTTPIYTSTNCPFIFGQNYQNKPFLGSIDLNETYIKVNGEYWFNGAHFFWQNNSTPLFTGVIKELPAHKPDKYQVDLKLVSPLEMLKDIEAKDFSDKVTGETLTYKSTDSDGHRIYWTTGTGVGGFDGVYANGVKLFEGVDYEVSDLNKLNYNAVIEVKNSTVFGQTFTVDYYYWKRGLSIEEIVSGVVALGGYSGATTDIQPVAWQNAVRSPSTASPLLAALGYYGNPAPDYKFNWRPTYGGSWAKTNPGNCTNILPQNFDYNFEISLINETTGSTVTSGSTIISLGDEYNSNTVNDGSRNIGVAGVKNGISVRIGNVRSMIASSMIASSKTIYVHQIVNGTATLLNSYRVSHSSTTNPSGPLTISRRGNTVTVYREGAQMATCTITGSMDYHFQGSYRNGRSGDVKDFHAYNQSWNFYDNNIVPHGANLTTPCIVTDTLDMTAGGQTWGAIEAELGQNAIYFLNAYFSTDAGATWSGAYSYNIGVNMARQERYLYYVLGVPDNQASFDIKDPSTYFYASTLVLNIVNLGNSTVLEALQDLALISGYEFGVDRQGVFFFRPRLSSTLPVYVLDHSELVKVDSVKKNLSDFFTKLTLTFAQVPLEFYANTGERPTPVDRYGIINKEIDKPDIVNYDNPELAQAIGPQLLEIYSALPNIIQAVGKLNLALELGDIVNLKRNLNLIADPEGSDFNKYRRQQTYYRACKITGMNYNFAKRQITYTLRDVSNSNNMPPIYAYGFPYDLPIQLGKLKTE